MKPTVRFKDLIYLSLGQPAMITPIDHPSPLVSNTGPVLTSNVVKINQDGVHDESSPSFETENTLYIPEAA